ncbi:guanine nucleotide-binding protein subunit alpha-12 [Danio aesculapii]|uniref:guanine nucleotide-binding protein subunit alpha-12 n=1 Tax=Danio aesculapii TaxID=1142201 RepID=UPI0024C0DFF0|nr:guanine nucleotide-binding protein subunit alpha-12 [Danio aesculapii]
MDKWHKIDHTLSASKARRRSRNIDAWLKREAQIPMLISLVGASNSGKSTFLKQIRLINGDDFNHKQRLRFREAIYDNIIQGMTMLVLERNKLAIPLQNSANEMHEILFTSNDFWKVNITEPSAFQPYVEAVDSLWKDSGIQETYRRSNVKWHEFGVCDSVKYHFDNIHRIGQLDYLPHNQDILYARNRRTTLEEKYHVLRDTPFAVAHLSHRYLVAKMQFYCCDTTILFIIGSSDYDRMSADSNCLAESLWLFNAVINQRYYSSSTVILLFNKMDLLKEKVQTADIRKHFPEFQGDPHRVEDVQEFLVQSFKMRKLENSRPVYYHMLTAVDTENIRTVFNTIKNAIKSNNFKDFSLL